MSESSAKIMIVEDDATIGRFVELELAHAGYEVSRFGDGEAALESIEAIRPDLVLLDLMLPGIDGLEVARACRARGLGRPDPHAHRALADPGRGHRLRRRCR